MRHKVFTENGTGATFERISGWLPRQTIYNPTPRHPMYYYRTDENGYREHDSKFNPANGTYVDGFKYKGTWLAVERFGWLGSVWCGGTPFSPVAKDGEFVVIGAVDMDGDMFHPLYLEMDCDGENGRLYVRID